MGGKITPKLKRPDGNQGVLGNYRICASLRNSMVALELCLGKFIWQNSFDIESESGVKRWKKRGDIGVLTGQVQPSAARL
jgi:hypothetical protein